MRRQSRPYMLLDHIDRARSLVFVPAIMSVGLVFSLASVAREAVRRRGMDALARRGAIGGHSIARMTLDGTRRPGSVALLRKRSFYAWITVALTTLALYVAIGSLANYFRVGDYVAHLGWMLAISLLIPSGLLMGAVVAGTTWVRYPDPPLWTRTLLAATPLSAPVEPRVKMSLRPRTIIGISIVTVLAGSFIALSFLTSVRPSVLAELDEVVAEALQDAWNGGGADVLGRTLGSTHVAVVLAGIIGLATVRCRPFALLYVAAIFSGLGLSTLSKFLVARPRPEYGILTDLSFPSDVWVGILDSFPSGHVVQVTLIAGLLPTALLVLTSRRWLALASIAPLWITLVVLSIARIAAGAHWPTDVIAGVLLGGFLVAVVHFALDNRTLHEMCSACPWSGEGA